MIFFFCFTNIGLLKLQWIWWLLDLLLKMGIEGEKEGPRKLETNIQNYATGSTPNP